MLNKNKDWANFTILATNLKKIRPVFFGRNSFKPINENNPLEKAENSKKMIENCIYYRIVEEGNRNVAEENIELLKKIEKISLQEDSDLLFTKYYLAQNYLKNKDYDNFSLISNNFLKFLSLTHWQGLLLPLLQSLEEVLKSKPNLTSELLICIVDLLIFKPESMNLKLQRYENLMKIMNNLDKDLIVRKSLHNREIVKIEFGFLSSSCCYYEKIDYEIRLEINQCFEGFFNVISMEFNEKNYNRKLVLDEMIKEKNVFKQRFSLNFEKFIPGDVFTLQGLEISSEKRNEKGSNVSLNFSIPRLLIIFGKNESVIMKPAINPFDVKLTYPTIGFLNEQIELIVSLQKTQNFNEKLNNVELFLYDQEIEYPFIIKSMPKLAANCKILTSSDKEYDNTLPIQIQNINSSEDISLKFLIRIEEEIEKKFTLYFKYSFEKSSPENNQNGVLNRDFLKKFSFQTMNPFVLRTRMKILNHFYNNIYKLENLGNKNQPFPLPLNYRSNILYYLTPPTIDCAIKQLRIEPMPSLYLKLLGSLTTNETIILKQNEVYTGGFIVIPTDLCEETPLGSLIIVWKRLEFLQDPSKPFNELRLNLNNVIVEEKPFEIDFSMKDLVEYGDLIQINLTFRNKTGNPQKILLILMETEGFLISGDIRKIFDAKNEEMKTFVFNVLPMNLGRKKVPGVQLICQSMDNKVIWDSSGTRFITVIPKKN